MSHLFNEFERLTKIKLSMKDREKKLNPNNYVNYNCFIV